MTLQEILFFGKESKVNTLKGTLVGTAIPTIEQQYQLSELLYQMKGENAEIARNQYLTIKKNILELKDCAILLEIPITTVKGSHSIINKEGNKLGFVKSINKIAIDIKLFKDTYSKVNSDKLKEIEDNTELSKEEKLKAFSEVPILKPAKIKFKETNKEVSLSYNDNEIFMDLLDISVDIFSNKRESNVLNAYLTDKAISEYKSIIALKMSELDRNKRLSHYSQLS